MRKPSSVEFLRMEARAQRGAPFSRTLQVQEQGLAPLERKEEKGKAASSALDRENKAPSGQSLEEGKAFLGRKNKVPKRTRPGRRKRLPGLSF